MTVANGVGHGGTSIPATDRIGGQYTPPSAGPGVSRPPEAIDPATLERVTIGKINSRVLPILFVLYMCCYLDRGNIAFAVLQMKRDLGFNGAAYSLGAAVFFIGYAVFEVPSNMILDRVGPRRWIARIGITWGILASCMMFVRNPASFYALRFLVGLAEAGFFPGVVYYLSRWYPIAFRARAVSRFMLAVPVVGIVGGPLGGALMSLDGRLGLAGWQWLFLVEGLPSVIFGALVILVLPDTTSDARWLRPPERAWLHERLTEDAARTLRPDVTLAQALGDRQVWTLSALMAFVLFAGYGYTFWAPTIVRETLGTSYGETGLVLGCVSVVTSVVMLVVGRHSDRTGERPLHVAGSALAIAIGYFGAAAVSSSTIALAFFFLVPSAAMSLFGPFWALSTRLLRGRAAAAGIALVSSVSNVGSFFSPIVASRIRDHTGGFAGAHLAFALAAFTAAVIALALRSRVLLITPARPTS